MTKTQLNYWDTMTDMLQETYRASLQSTAHFQENFSHMLKEAVETGTKSVTGLHTTMYDMMQRATDSNIEILGKFNQLYVENTEKGISTLKEIMEKHRIDNESFRKELETLWKNNGETFRLKLEEIGRNLKNNHAKQVESLTKTYME